MMKISGKELVAVLSICGALCLCACSRKKSESPESTNGPLSVNMSAVGKSWEWHFSSASGQPVPRKQWAVSVDSIIGNVSSDSRGRLSAITALPTCNSARSGAVVALSELHNGVFQCEDKTPASQHGYLSVYDDAGKTLWRYPSKEQLDVMAVFSVNVSASGKYVAASLYQEPCHEGTWQINPDEGRFVIAKGTAPVKFLLGEFFNEDIKSREVDYKTFGVSYETLPSRTTLGSSLLYLQTKTQKTDVCTSKNALFSSDGKLLWSRPGVGFPKISPDGRYLMTIPYVLSDDKKMFIYGNAWQLFDISGNLLAEKKVEAKRDVYDVLLLEEDADTNGPFAADGRYFIFAGAIWDASGQKPEKLAIDGLVSDDLLLRISPDGKYALAGLPNPPVSEIDIYAKGIKLIDILQRKVILSNPYPEFPETIRELSYRQVYSYPFVRYNRHVAFNGRYLIWQYMRSAQEQGAGDGMDMNCMVFGLDLLKAGDAHAIYFGCSSDFSLADIDKVLLGLRMVHLPEGKEQWYSSDYLSHMTVFDKGNGFLLATRTALQQYKVSQ